MKRKGNVVVSRTCSVVRELPDEPEDSNSSRLLSPDSGIDEMNQNDNNNDYYLSSQMEALSTSPSSSSPRSTAIAADPFVSWEQTRQELKHFVSSGDGGCERKTSECVAMIDLYSTTLHYLETTAPAELTKQANAIQSNLRQQIAAETHLSKEENDGLAQVQQDLDLLEVELQKSKDNYNTLLQQKEDIICQIKDFQMEAAEDLGEFDELEASMIQQVPRMKKGIALFARSTGIKWNYDNLDVLAGEVVRTSMSFT
jgi:hypothetical protein